MNPLLALVLAAVTVTYHPKAPAVGDLITIDFAAPVALEPSSDFEIVKQEGSRVVVRTFRPAPFVLHGVTGGVQFRNLVVPVRSVLDPTQPMTPAPLVPPHAVDYPRRPFQLLGVAALAALLTWIAVWLRARRPARRSDTVQTPEERFREAVAVLCQRSDPARWAALADETRLYLAATRAHLGSELTTRELLSRLGTDAAIVKDILRQGDLEKFSTRGAEALPFDEVAARALALAAPAVEPGEEGAAA